MSYSYDVVAERYDRTRGGEERGDQYAGELAKRVRSIGMPVLELGVGTGVVALGMQRRGARVVGVDLSTGMLSVARQRLDGPVLMADACRLPLGTASFDNVISVWMIQAVTNAPALFAEAFRVLRPMGRFLVCPTNRPGLRDPIGVVIARMFVRLDEFTAPQGHSARPIVDAEQVLRWGLAAGFAGHIEQLPDDRWTSDVEEEIRSIEERTWAPLSALDDEAFEAIAGPALATLRRLPRREVQRRAMSHVVVLEKPDAESGA